jgi:hypothetical protein
MTNWHGDQAGRGHSEKYRFNRLITISQSEMARKPRELAPRLKLREPSVRTLWVRQIDRPATQPQMAITHPWGA